MTKLDMFTCAKLACRLSVAACARRHQLADPQRRPLPGQPTGEQFLSCLSCATGETHAKAVE